MFACLFVWVWAWVGVGVESGECKGVGGSLSLSRIQHRQHKRSREPPTQPLTRPLQHTDIHNKATNQCICMSTSQYAPLNTTQYTNTPVSTHQSLRIPGNERQREIGFVCSYLVRTVVKIKYGKRFKIMTIICSPYFF